MLEYRLIKPYFLDAYLQLRPDQQQRIRALIAEVRQTPNPDDIRRIRVESVNGIHCKAFDEDASLWLVYYVQNQIVWCVSCGHETPYIDVMTDLKIDASPDRN